MLRRRRRSAQARAGARSSRTPTRSAVANASAARGFRARLGRRFGAAVRDLGAGARRSSASRAALAAPSLFVGRDGLAGLCPWPTSSVDLSLAASLDSAPRFLDEIALRLAFVLEIRLVPTAALQTEPRAPTRAASACDLPHSGHLRSGPSVIFCKASRWCPHAAQRYS